MPYRIEQFKCIECNKEQEQLVNNTDGEAEEPCEFCGAESQDLERIMSTSVHGRHISWSKWTV